MWVYHSCALWAVMTLHLLLAEIREVSKWEYTFSTLPQSFNKNINCLLILPSSTPPPPHPPAKKPPPNHPQQKKPTKQNKSRIKNRKKITCYNNPLCSQTGPERRTVRTERCARGWKGGRDKTWRQLTSPPGGGEEPPRPKPCCSRREKGSSSPPPPRYPPLSPGRWALHPRPGRAAPCPSLPSCPSPWSAAPKSQPEAAVRQQKRQGISQAAAPASWRWVCFWLLAPGARCVKQIPRRWGRSGFRDSGGRREIQANTPNQNKKREEPRKHLLLIISRGEKPTLFFLWPSAAGSKGKEGTGADLLTKQGSRCPHPIATPVSSRLREVRGARGGCRGNPGKGSPKPHQKQGAEMKVSK